MNLLLCVLLAAAPVAQGDHCPHWLSVMPLATNDADAVAADAVAQANETIIDGIAWCCRLLPAGDPVADAAANLLEPYRLLSRRVRAANPNIRQGVLMQCTMGHGSFPGQAAPWQLTVKPDGSSVYRLCPLDKRFLDYIARACRTLGTLKPDFFMVDDDTRLVFGDVPGCFCPLHIAAFEKATGRSWTREQIVAAIEAKDASVRSVWEQIKFDSLATFFRTIRANFPADVAGMLCTVSRAAHFRHAKTFAQMLAAPGQTPVVRGNGANYCGNDVFHVFMHRALWAHEKARLGEGVVFLQEADTCPQTLWSCSATRQCESMVVQALEGVKGAKIWITRLSRTPERRSQRAFRRALAACSGLLRWAEKVDFHQRGVVLPVCDTYEGFAERYLALMGIPYRYGKAGPDDVMALCADNLRAMSRGEIEAALAGRLIIDGSAAIWLAENGFADAIGVHAKQWGLKTVQSHRDAELGELGGFHVDKNVADLTAHAVEAVELSKLYNVPYAGAARAYVAPGSLAYTNARGGRVVVFAQPLRENMPAYYNTAMFSEGYKTWIIKRLTRLADGLPGGLYCADAGPVMCEAGTTEQDGDIFVLDPIDIDDLVEPEMAFAQTPSAIERLGNDGRWRPVPCTRKANGNVRLKTTVRAKTPAVFRYR